MKLANGMNATQANEYERVCKSNVLQCITITEFPIECLSV